MTACTLPSSIALAYGGMATQVSSFRSLHGAHYPLDAVRWRRPEVDRMEYVLPAIVAVVVGPLSAWITVKLSLRRFRAEKWWELGFHPVLPLTRRKPMNGIMIRIRSNQAMRGALSPGNAQVSGDGPPCRTGSPSTPSSCGETGAGDTGQSAPQAGRGCEATACRRERPNENPDRRRSLPHRAEHRPHPSLQTDPGQRT